MKKRPEVVSREIANAERIGMLFIIASSIVVLLTAWAVCLFFR